MLTIDTVAESKDKRSVTVWPPSVRLSLPSFFLTLIGRTSHTQRDSLKGSTRRRQRTFRPDNKEVRHTC